jgi:hypothetical protein
VGITLIDHYEAYLGEIQSGGVARDQNGNMTIHIARFAEDRFGVRTLATLGLSRHLLQTWNGSSIRQELIFGFWRDLDPSLVAGLLADVTEGILADHRALYSAQIIEKRGRLFQGYDYVGLIACRPVYLDSNFIIAELEAGPVYMTWLVPITQADIDYANQFGATELQRIIYEYPTNFLGIGAHAVSVAGEGK